MEENKNLLQSPGSYRLLVGYMNESKILALAYDKSSSYFRFVYKCLTYPIVVTSAVATVCASLDVNKYIIVGLSLVTLILSGFNSAVNPKDKQNNAHNVSIEFSEIHSNVQQFVCENHKTGDEIKAHAQLIHELLNVWKSQAPPISKCYLKQAAAESILRIRQSQKNGTQSPRLEFRGLEKLPEVIQ